VRYYDIKLSDAKGKPVLASSMGGRPISSLLADGTHNPSALNIEFDIPYMNTPNPDTNAILRIWGLSLKDISAALDLNGKYVEIRAGMTKGLPLANPAQRGLLLKGQIIQAFGNWVGTDMTLDLNFQAPNAAVYTQPLNLIWSWYAGQPIDRAIGKTLDTALRPTTPNIDIKIATLDKGLVTASDDIGFYADVSQFASHLKELSRKLVNRPDYPGISIVTDGVTMRVYDTQAPPSAPSQAATSPTPSPAARKAIDYRDMLGQPTWIRSNSISLKLVLRGDLSVGDDILVPKGQQTLTQNTLQNFSGAPSSQSTFTGKFQIASINHYGNFRQADAASWNTTITAFPN
jgi:hypothetical protein